MKKTENDQPKKPVPTLFAVVIFYDKTNVSVAFRKINGTCNRTQISDSNLCNFGGVFKIPHHDLLAANQKNARNKYCDRTVPDHDKILTATKAQQDPDPSLAWANHGLD